MREQSAELARCIASRLEGWFAICQTQIEQGHSRRSGNCPQFKLIIDINKQERRVSTKAGVDSEKTWMWVTKCESVSKRRKEWAVMRENQDRTVRWGWKHGAEWDNERKARTWWPRPRAELSLQWWKCGDTQGDTSHVNAALKTRIRYA
jgi:hypothetical protein